MFIWNRGGGQKPPNSEGEHANDDTTLRDFVLQDTETVCQSKQYEIAFHVGKWSLLSQWRLRTVCLLKNVIVLPEVFYLSEHNLLKSSPNFSTFEE